MRKLLFTVAMIAAVAFTAPAQDYTFSQFYTLPLMRNPALAGGFRGDFQLQSVYRNQWQSVTVPFRTGGLGLELKLPGDKMTFGLQTIYDIAGDSKLKRIQLLPSFCYHVYLAEDTKLTFGGLAGVISSQFDPTALKWDDQYVNGQYSPANPTSQIIKNSSRNYLDFAAGISFTAPMTNGFWYAGGALYHLTRPRVTFGDSEDDNARLNRKYVLNFGMNFQLDDLSTISVYSDYLWQGGHRQWLVGGYFTYDVLQEDIEKDERISVSVGGLYRLDDALIPVIKLEWYRWSLGVSYDFNISKLKTASQVRGGLELSLGVRGLIRARDSRIRQMDCYKFAR